MILTIKTDNPKAEVGLLSASGEQLGYIKWQAHRELSETILIKIKQILNDNSADFKDLTGVIFYEGPGSFTGLRIGASVANALGLPVANASDENWLLEGIPLLKHAKASAALPKYGSEPNITRPRK